MRWRSAFVLFGFIAVVAALGARSAQLQLRDHQKYADKSEASQLRTRKLAAHRGIISDRHGRKLAVSTPVDSVAANPRTLVQHGPEELAALARALEVDADWLMRRITRDPQQSFVYLRRHMNPARAEQVKALGLKGISLHREYKRYYPVGEVAGHVVGFTNIDDEGQEGLELGYDGWVRGEPGAKQVLLDAGRRAVEDVALLKPVRPGKTLTTSIDLRIQYLAYRSLKGAVAKHRAASGSVVVIDVGTGEVLAIANQPSYNPNDRRQYLPRLHRNRAVTDIFEPGSSFKTMVMACALESGDYLPGTMIDTSPGEVEIGGKVIKDRSNFGRIDATTILARSSNVGITRISQTLPSSELWQCLSQLGLGQLTGSGFPGESAGVLRNHQHWRPIGQATLSYGYGLSVTTLQLAQAYAAIGAGGVRYPMSFLKLDSAPVGHRVLSEQTAIDLIAMLERVVGKGGTGMQAAVAGYRIAGKTGTAWKSEAGGYSRDRYLAVFAGLAPASAPRVAAVVVIDEPAAGAYHGGDVAAPVFSEIMSDALRLLAVPPDARPGAPGIGIPVQAQVIMPPAGAGVGAAPTGDPVVAAEAVGTAPAVAVSGGALTLEGGR